MLPASTYINIISELGAAEFHWHFVQGYQALERELYLPGVTTLIAGIEASLRVTMHQLNEVELPQDGVLGATLCNKLLRTAHNQGLPVTCLAFPDEDDFYSKLQTISNHVAIVEVRHDLAHGNILQYVDRDFDGDNAFFRGIFRSCGRAKKGRILIGSFPPEQETNQDTPDD